MTKEEREVMRMALEALTIFREWELGQDYNSNRDTVLVRAFKAEEAIEKCLANDAVDSEPVVWMYQNKSTHEVQFQKYMRSFVDHSAWYEVPLYSEPLANQEKTSGSPIKEALAQPEQEPVAWRYALTVEGTEVAVRYDHANWNMKYEPFGRHGIDHGGKVTRKPVYTTPPQRKPLTDEQIANCISGIFAERNYWVKFARAIEAAVWEKNA